MAVGDDDARGEGRVRVWLAAIGVILVRSGWASGLTSRGMPAGAMSARGREIGVTGLRRLTRCHSRRVAERVQVAAGWRASA